MEEAIGRKHRGWRFGTFEADVDTRELRKHGVRLKLSGQPFRALELLLLNQGEVVSRDQLRAALWPGEQWGDYDQRLNKTINKLREALSDSADNPRLLETVPRVGYRFLCPAVPLAPLEVTTDLKPHPIRPEIATVSIHESLPLTGPTVPPSLPKRKFTAFGAILVGLGCVAAVVIGYAFFKSPQQSSSPTLVANQPTPLTTYIGSEQYPQFSPDGKMIVFAWDRGDQRGSHIFTLSLQDGELREITKTRSKDYAPVWSPDSKNIAFVRSSREGTSELWITSPADTGERKLVDLGDAVGDNHPVSWTRNPKWLIVSARPTGDGPPTLYLTSYADGTQHRLSSPSLQSAGDLSPIVSPDGTKVAFTRGSTVARRDIYMLRLTEDLSAADEPIRVTDLRAVVDTIAWTPDGKQLYFTFGSTVSGNRRIAHISAIGYAGRRDYIDTGLEGVHPALSPSGDSLCYVRTNIEETSIWRLRVRDNQQASELAREKLVSSTRKDYTADLSSDGKRIVFSSVRSGESEIWVSDVSGGSLRQITRKGASTPRWSPEGQRIAYESPAAGAPDIYVFDLRSNREQRLTFGAGSNLRPSWSRDGKFIYFGSSRSGESQIWRVPSNGGAETQITHEGGTYAVESPDGRSIYFTSPSQPPSVRVKSFDSGIEKTLVEDAIGYSSISMGDGGLYYLKSLTSASIALNFLDFGNRNSREIARLDHPVHHFLSSPPDGNSVLYTQIDREDRDLMVVKLH